VNDIREEQVSTPRFGALIGLALGAIWALADLEGAVVAGFLAAVGYYAPSVLAGRVDLSRFLGDERSGRGPAPDSTPPRQRTNLQ
jgi:hypothetical protein